MLMERFVNYKLHNFDFLFYNFYAKPLKMYPEDKKQICLVFMESRILKVIILWPLSLKTSMPRVIFISVKNQ